MRIAFDIGGVLSKYPEYFRPFIVNLMDAGVEVFVITDMHPHEEVLQTLAMNDFDRIPAENVRCADFTVHGEGCKMVLLEELKIDMFFDDFIGYMTPGGAPIRLLIMPDHERPYWADTWKVPAGKDMEFGRRRFTKRQVKGRDV